MAEPLRRRRRGLPFAVLRGYNGTDLPDAHDTIKPITCPFTGEKLAAVPALDPDVAIIHAQRADRQGNVSCGASPACRRRRCSAPSARIVTVEEIVDELGRRPDAVVLPALGRRPRVRRGAGRRAARPTRRATTTRDNDVYRAWDAISRDRDAFERVDATARARLEARHERRADRPPTR